MELSGEKGSLRKGDFSSSDTTSLPALPFARFLFALLASVAVFVFLESVSELGSSFNLVQTSSPTIVRNAVIRRKEIAIFGIRPS